MKKPSSDSIIGLYEKSTTGLECPEQINGIFLVAIILIKIFNWKTQNCFVQKKRYKNDTVKYKRRITTKI